MYAHEVDKPDEQKVYTYVYTRENVPFFPVPEFDKGNWSRRARTYNLEARLLMRVLFLPLSLISRPRHRLDREIIFDTLRALARLD